MMRRALKRLGVRKAEVGFLVRFSLLNLLIIASYTLARTTRDAVFLEELSAKRLPYLYIAVALWTALVSSLMGRRTARHAINRALARILIASGIILFAFAPLLQHFTGPVMPIVFYLWLGANGLILLSFFGILINESIDAQTFKRVIGIIGTGGILGGMLGGALATSLAPTLGAERLLAIAGILLVAGAPLAMRSGASSRSRHASQALEQDLSSIAGHDSEARSKRQAPGDTSDVDASTERPPILRDSYVRTMALMFLMGGLVASFLDYQFKVMIDAHTEGRSEISRLLGFYYGALSLVAILVQMFITGPFLRRVGSSIASSLLPAGVALGSLASLALPGSAWFVAGTRLYDATMRLTLTRSSWEFLYFPMKPALRRRVRTFIEAVVDRTAEGLGGVLILVFTWLLGGTPVQMAILALVFSIVWFVCNEYLNRAYVQQLSMSLREQTLPIERKSDSLREEQLIEEANRLLTSPFETRAVFAFELLGSLDPEGLDEKLPGLLQHPVAAIRARTISRLSDLNESLVTPHLENFMRDESLEVRAEAIRFHCTRQEDYEEEFSQLLHSEDEVIRGAAILCAATHSPAYLEPQLEKMLDYFIAEGTVEDRRNVAVALGRRKQPSPLHRKLEKLLEDPNLEVQRQAILSTGTPRLREVVPTLIRALGSRSTREASTVALADYGDRVVGTLGDYLLDETVPMEVRGEIPSVLSRIKTQASVEQLLRLPPTSNPGLAVRALKAQNKIRARNSDAAFPGEAIRVALDHDIETFLRLNFHMQAWLPQNVSRHRDLLYKALAERRGTALNHIFRRLQLLYEPQEVLVTYRAYAAPDRHTHAQSLEYLEAFLRTEDRQLVLRALDDQQERRRRALAASRFGLKPFTLTSSLDDLLRRPDSWLQSCALYWIGNERLHDLADAIRSLRTDHPLVLETRSWSLEQLEAN